MGHPISSTVPVVLDRFLLNMNSGQTHTQFPNVTYSIGTIDERYHFGLKDSS